MSRTEQVAKPLACRLSLPQHCQGWMRTLGCDDWVEPGQYEEAAAAGRRSARTS